MPAPTNNFKKDLREKRQLIGCWVGLAGAYTAEISTTAGFDWLLIDGEHAPNDLRSVLTQLQVVDGSDSYPVVRLPIGETWLIKQFLDAGAQNLLVPMVESRDQAIELVKAVRYPPHGVRGVGSALARASRFASIPDYLTTADEQICLLVQVESVAGLEALDEILDVEGVDGVFIGPSDLAADMGYLGKPGEPEVVAAVTGAIEKIVQSGKAAGILTADNSMAQECLRLGANFVAVGVDVTMFAGAMRARANETKAWLQS